MKGKAVIKILKNLDLTFSIFSLTILVVITFLGVIWRYFFKNPFIWLEEAQLWLIVWTVCFGSSAVFRYEGHISIDVLVDMLPKSVQKIIQIIVYLVVIVVLVFLLINGIRYVQQLAGSHRVTGILKIPYSLIYSAFPIGVVMMVFSFSQSTYNELFKTRNGREGLKSGD